MVAGDRPGSRRRRCAVGNDSPWRRRRLYRSLFDQFGRIADVETAVISHAVRAEITVKGRVAQGHFSRQAAFNAGESLASTRPVQSQRPASRWRAAIQIRLVRGYADAFMTKR